MDVKAKTRKRLAFFILSYIQLFTIIMVNI